MNDDLLFRRNALSKRRAELLEQIASCADSIAAIDKELMKPCAAALRLIEGHAFDGVDIDGLN